jgi:ribosomal protein L11 methyltransferase
MPQPHRRPDVRYIEIIAEVPTIDADRATHILRTLTEVGLWIETPFSQADLESEGVVKLDGTYRVHAYLPADTDRSGAVLLVREHLDAANIAAGIETRVIADEDWAEAWKEHFHVERYGQRIVVVPSWREYTPQEGEAVFTLDPGMAFGTGQHETTRMCLEALERTVTTGMRVLDVGCGSGILAIAGAKLGAGDSYAVDVDTICVNVTATNAASNDVAVQVKQGSLGDDWPFSEPATNFDVIVANIIANPLIDMAPEISRTLKPGGRLIASGVIATRESEVVGAFEASGLRLDHVRSMGEWCCIEATR